MNRKLKAVWTYEAAQDLRSQHNLDAEAELTAILAQEINNEIDLEVLRDLMNIRQELRPKKKKRSFRSITDEWSPSAVS